MKSYKGFKEAGAFVLANCPQSPASRAEMAVSEEDSMSDEVDVTPWEMSQALLGLVGGAGVFATLIRYVPPKMDFISVVVWAVVCSACSGIVWAGLVGISNWLRKKRSSSTLRPGFLSNVFAINEEIGIAGGINKEPKYLFDSILFAAIVFGPLTFVAARIQEKGNLAAPRSVYVAFLLGAAIGSCWFYRGRTRDRMMARGLSYKSRESRLAWIWTAKLAIPSFVLYELAMVFFVGGYAFSLGRLLTRMAVVSFFLPLFVSALALILPGKDEDEKIRGVIAGLMLVLMFLSGLLIMQPLDLWNWLDEVSNRFSSLF